MQAFFQSAGLTPYYVNNQTPPEDKRTEFATMDAQLGAPHFKLNLAWEKFGEPMEFSPNLIHVFSRGFPWIIRAFDLNMYRYTLRHNLE